MMALLRSENLKIFTTKVWWAMLLGLFGWLVLALLSNSGLAISDLTDSNDQAFSSDAHAANLYTSGQYFGVLFAAILGALLATNEHKHQTLTSTFLATPRRERVMGAKLLVALMWGAVYAAFTTAISVPIGASVLNIADASTYLTDAGVLKAIVLNLLAYGIWAIIGFGIGSMFRGQAGPVALLIVGYFATSVILQILLAIAAGVLDRPGLLDVYWYLPNGATQVMTSAGTQLQLLSDSDTGTVPWWLGGLVLLAYGAVTAGVGINLTLKRDVG